MKNTKEILEKLKEAQDVIQQKENKRKVTFDPSVINYQRELTPYQHVKKKPNYSKIEKLMFHYIYEGSVEELEVYLKGFSQKEIDEFFKEKGALLFSSAIIDANDSKPLSMLLKVTTSHIVDDILFQNNFHLLDGFLGSQETLEQLGYANESTERSAAEKINILLEKCSNTIQEYITNFIPKLPESMQRKLK